MKKEEISTLLVDINTINDLCTSGTKKLKEKQDEFENYRATSLLVSEPNIEIIFFLLLSSVFWEHFSFFSYLSCAPSFLSSILFFSSFFPSFISLLLFSLPSFQFFPFLLTNFFPSLLLPSFFTSFLFFFLTSPLPSFLPSFLYHLFSYLFLIFLTFSPLFNLFSLPSFPIHYFLFLFLGQTKESRESSCFIIST